VENETCGLSLYADPMLEKVLYCLIENAKKHGETITKICISGTPVPAGYLLVVEDDGVGVPADRKEKIFNKNVGKGSEGFGLFLAREILSITGITIAETGEPGSGARFEMFLPSGKFRIKCPDSPSVR
jgi:K+-sensing histidine kinase KdpD